MIKQLQFLKKNWKGTVLGVITGYGLFILSARAQGFNLLSILLIPGIFLGGILFKVFDTLNIIHMSGGFEDLAYAIMFMVIINTIIFGIAGAYIQNKYFKR